MSFIASTGSRESFHSSLLQTLSERGYISQCTDYAGLDEVLHSGIVPAYIGFDATADSLHVGHLLPIMTLRWLQRCGHKPIVLMGGGTTRIGDPSFRTESRPLLADEQIAKNIAGIRGVFERFVKFGEGPTDAVLVNNAEWLDELRYIPMLRDIGRHFSVNRMLSFESVKSRLDRNESLSFLEFNYMILQAYDFLELSRRKGCRLQMGGSDQWGNIVNGIELVRRLEDRQVFGLTAPLLTTSSGAKMGKTAAGAVWLNGERLSPYDYWQFWRNTEDGDVGRFLRLFTDLPMEEVTRLEALTGADVNAAKVVLANEATTLAHGVDAARAASETALKTFESGGTGDGLPTFYVTTAEMREGLPLPDLLVRAGLTSSKGEARRLIQGGGARLNGSAIVGDDTRVNLSDFLGRNGIRLSAGRKRHVIVELTD